MAEVHELSAVALRDALRSGELSARQAAEHFLDRIASGNPHLGAFITVTAERALEDAEAADSRHARASNRAGAEDSRAALPLLHGMPTAFKDLADVAGVVTTHGSAALEHKPAAADGADRVLGLGRQAQFAHQQDVERERERHRHREPDRYATARQCKHDGVGLMGIGAQGVRKQLAGLRAMR